MVIPLRCCLPHSLVSILRQSGLPKLSPRDLQRPTAALQQDAAAVLEPTANRRMLEQWHDRVAACKVPFWLSKVDIMVFALAC